MDDISEVINIVRVVQRAHYVMDNIYRDLFGNIPICITQALRNAHTIRRELEELLETGPNIGRGIPEGLERDLVVARVGAYLRVPRLMITQISEFINRFSRPF
jgi:hypothetical protein